MRQAHHALTNDSVQIQRKQLPKFKKMSVNLSISNSALGYIVAAIQT